MRRAESEYDFLTITPQLPPAIMQQRIEHVLDTLGFESLRQENDGGFVYQVPNKGTIKAHYGRAIYDDPELGDREADCLLYYNGLDEVIREQVRERLEEEFNDETVRAA